jgi:hypothetical protein
MPQSIQQPGPFVPEDYTSITTGDYAEHLLGLNLLEGLEIYKGNVPGIIHDYKFGVSTPIQTGTPEDVWNLGGLYTGHPVGAPERIAVFSNNAADTALGTGARTVLLRGLDQNYNAIEELATMNGTTPVVSTNLFHRLYKIYVMSAGSTGSNVGTIIGRHEITTANVFVSMFPTFNQTGIVACTVPADKWMAIYNVFFIIQSGVSANISIRTREFGKVYWPKRIFHIKAATPFVQQYTHPLYLPPKTDVKIRVDEVSNNNTVIIAGFEYFNMDA